MTQLAALAAALLAATSALALPAPTATPAATPAAALSTEAATPHRSTGQKIADHIRSQGVPVDLTIAAISTLPIVELRGAVPVGHVLLPDTDTSTRLGADDLRRSARILLAAVIGNMLPVPFILLLLGPVSNLLMKIPIGKSFFDWLFTRTRRKTADIEKYEFWGLAIFVGIPLPVTGAWTGAAAAWLLGIPFWRTMLSILLGVIFAGIIMTTLALMGWLGAVVAGVVLVALFASALLRKPAKVL